MQTLFGFDDLAENRSPEKPGPKPSEASTMLVRPQVISRIIDRNPTASASFLEQFSDTQLRFYLDHLCMVDTPRGSALPWNRPGDAPTVIFTRSVA